MKKKWVSLLLSAMMVFTLSACSLGGKSSTPAPTQPTTETATTETGELKPEEGASLVVWESKEARPFVEAINKEFTDKYGIPVKFEEVSGGDTANKLTTDGPAGIGADVLMFPHDNLGRVVTAGLIMPNDFHEEETRKNNSELSVNASSYDGILYGYPRSIETYLMFYNKKLLPDGAPKTMEEVIELSKTMNDPAKKQYTFMWEMGNFYFDFFWIASTGGYIFGQNDTDATDLGLNNEGAVSGLKFQQDFVKQVLPLKTSDVTFDIKKGLFTNGQLAMSVDGPWVIGDLKKSGMDFGAAPIPSIQGKPSKSFSGVKSWYVNAYTKYPNAAKLYAQFASTKEAQLKEFEMTGTVPANNEAATDSKVANDPITSAILEQFKNSYLMPAIPEMNSVWSPMAAAFSDVLNKGKDPKQALDGATKQITDAIGQ